MTMTHPVSPGATVDVNPASAIAVTAHHHPGKLAIRYAGGDLTFAQLDVRAARLAAALADRGVGAGDRIAYLGLNSPAFLITMLAAFRLGAIFVPVNFRLAEPELGAVLRGSGAIAAVCEPSHRELLDAVRHETAVRLLLLVDDDTEVPAEGSPLGWEPWSPLLTTMRKPTTVPLRRVFDQPAILMFTSGTTGFPKGVILTYGNLWWNGINVDSRLDTRRGDVTHAAAPLFHIGGLNALALRTLVRGGTLVIRRGFEPVVFLRDLIDFEVNSFFAVPAMLAALARVPELARTALPHLRTIVVAGAPVPTSLIEHYAAQGMTLQQAWGLTETAPFATHLPAEFTEAKIGSAGIPMPHTEVRVVDPTNTPVPAGSAGEVVVRGPNVTPGYWNNPAATGAAFDWEGWFHSGDIGYLDEDGFLYIVDRLKDMIVSGGENIYPAEVERALADLPGILDVAVIGTPDDQWGETVTAVISCAAGTELTLEDVRQHTASKLARYKLPRRLHVVETVPRNASGKLDKVRIRHLIDKEVRP
ncbi:long-chain fatty acid--CoA ligase [Nocardia vinacea]|uniref:Long-chain fatty acid--CoA ligase n=1 Tax=Nocardia vinacea TaxID=96468 RepID=A0ABZ1YNJ2_9NOCA|nr:long-chain fatty acid--CoA ligase [Nocardia vinacea]